MAFTRNFVSENLKNGDRVRDTRDGRMHTIGNHNLDKGWEIYPDDLNIEADGIILYVPDNRLPGNLELLIDD
jgi:hypothetical protein